MRLYKKGVIEMSDLYGIITPILAGIAVLASATAAYLWYRKREIVELVMEVIDAYDDKNISEEEYGKIVRKLKDVIYKK